MNTGNIRILCESLDKCRSELNSAKQFREGLNFNGHQEIARVILGKSSIDVSWLGRETGYMSKLISGRDMILLGMQKVANANIDYWEKKVQQATMELQKSIGE